MFQVVLAYSFYSNVFFVGFDATMKPERKENYSMVFDGTDLAYHYEDLTLTDFWVKNAKTQNWNEAVSEHIVKDEQFRMAKRSHDERGVSFQLTLLLFISV